MRRLTRIKNWDVLEPSPVSGSILAAVLVDRDGYKVRDGLKVTRFSDNTPYYIKLRYEPAWEPDTATNERPTIPEIDPLLEGPFLVCAKPKAFGQKGITHNPLALDGLHVEFAQLRNVGEIERFASRYGLLGYGFQVQGPLLTDGGTWDDYGESIPFWFHHIGRVRMIREICNILEHEREAELLPYISRQYGVGFADRAYEEFATPFTQQYRASPHFHSGHEYDEEISLSQIAFWAIDDILNSRIKESSYVAVNAGDPDFYIIVSDLIGAIYWHLSRELSGAAPAARLCHHCQTLMHDVRNDAKFCSPSCRQKAFQLKKKQGKQS